MPGLFKLKTDNMKSETYKKYAKEYKELEQSYKDRISKFKTLISNYDKLKSVKTDKAFETFATNCEVIANKLELIKNDAEMQIEDKFKNWENLTYSDLLQKGKNQLTKSQLGSEGCYRHAKSIKDSWKKADALRTKIGNGVKSKNDKTYEKYSAMWVDLRNYTDKIKEQMSMHGVLKSRYLIKEKGRISGNFKIFHKFLNMLKSKLNEGNS